MNFALRAQADKMSALRDYLPAAKNLLRQNGEFRRLHQ